ncbi:Isoleucine--Trna Ligase [Manis pentadactyla]|nr:Isoleucine--Trna Ligase [Manis pentadactyla]
MGSSFPETTRPSSSSDCRRTRFLLTSSRWLSSSQLWQRPGLDANAKENLADGLSLISGKNSKSGKERQL